MKIIVDKEPNLENAFKLLELYSSDPEKHRQLEERLRSDADFAYEMAAQYEKGERKGIQKGEEMAKLELARKMLECGEPLEKVLLFTGLTEEKIR